MGTVHRRRDFSVLVLAAFDRFVASHQIPLSAFGTYWALALPYVAAAASSRDTCFQRAEVRASARRVVAIYGAGDAGARLCSVLLGGPDFRADRLRRRQEGAAGQQHQRHPGLRRRRRFPSSCGSTGSAASCSRCPRPRAAVAARSSPARAARRARAVRARPVRSDLRQGADRRAARRRRRAICLAARPGASEAQARRVAASAASA